MHDKQDAKEAGYLKRLILGLNQYSSQVYGLVSEGNDDVNCKLQIVHLNNGLIALYTEED